MTINISPLTTELDEGAVAFLTDLVEDLMTDGAPFTSVDIANEAKKAGHFARNRWVAAWLRSNVIEIAHQLSALYNQTLIEVDSAIDGPVLAYLYHHKDFDTDDYSARAQDPLQTVGPRAAPVQSPVRVQAIKVNVPDGTPDVVLDQHIQAVSGATGAVTTTVPAAARAKTSQTSSLPKRDQYGRFTNNPGATVQPPTHFMRQHRDGKGRFTK